jgi:hypothetical protein
VSPGESLMPDFFLERGRDFRWTDVEGNVATDSPLFCPFGALGSCCFVTQGSASRAVPLRFALG